MSDRSVCRVQERWPLGPQVCWSHWQDSICRGRKNCHFPQGTTVALSCWCDEVQVFCPCPSFTPSFWFTYTGAGTISSRMPTPPHLSSALLFAVMAGTWQNTLKVYFFVFNSLALFSSQRPGTGWCIQRQGECLLKIFLIVDRCSPVLPTPSLHSPPPRGSVSYSLKHFFSSYFFLLLGLTTELFSYLLCSCLTAVFAFWPALDESNCMPCQENDCVPFRFSYLV